MAKPDIFDRLFALRLFAPLARYREVLLYLLFGGLTTVVSIGSFWVFCSVWHWNELLANVLSWVLAVGFAFVTSRLWVFQSEGMLMSQACRFYGGRVATLAVETLLILVFITWLRFPEMAVKIAAQVIVLILNYVVSKVFVFKNSDKG